MVVPIAPSEIPKPFKIPSPKLPEALCRSITAIFTKPSLVEEVKNS